MPLRTLHDEAAGLLKGTADITLKGRQLDEHRADRETELTGRVIAEHGDTKRQQMQNDAQLIDITEALANGAERATGDPAWKDMVGKKLRADVYSAMLVHGQRNDISNSYDFQDAVEGDKTQTYLLNRKTGERIPLGTAGSGGKKKGAGTGLSSTDKEFLKTFRQYSKDTEGFNYAMAEGLADSDPKQAEDLNMKLKFVEENEERFNKLQGTPSSAKPKPAKTGAGADQVTAYMKQNKVRDTPANREWARKQISG